MNLDKLVSKLKEEDAFYARISRFIQIFYWILIPVYITLAIFDFREEREINGLIGTFCFISAFLIFAIFFGKYYKEYKYVDYSLPTIQMLKKAAKRYQPFPLRTVWVIVGLLIMDAGITLDTLKDLPVYVVQIFVLGMFSIGIIIGLLIWKKKYKPIRDNALVMIKELEEE